MTQIIGDSLRPSVPPAAPKNQRVCRHFARGRCTWGTSCRFSHDVERAAADDTCINQAFIGLQQEQLQKERHAILKAALDGDFEIKAYNVADGFQRHVVQLRISSSSILIPRLLTEESLQQQLIELEGNEQLRIGGLLFLVGEPAVFWSMIQLYCLRRTTTIPKWDTLLANAKRGYVECMFFRSAMGCLSNDCPFVHNLTAAATLNPPLHSMATNNALLAPLLGISLTSTAATPPVATIATNNNNINNNNNSTTTKAHVIGGFRTPADSTKRVPVTSLSVVKGEESVVFRDPIWGTCAIPDLKEVSEPQESLSTLWESGVRGVAEVIW